MIQYQFWYYIVYASKNNIGVRYKLQSWLGRVGREIHDIKVRTIISTYMTMHETYGIKGFLVETNNRTMRSVIYD